MRIEDLVPSTAANRAKRLREYRLERRKRQLAGLREYQAERVRRKR